MNRYEYYRQLDKRRALRRWAGMFNFIGAVVAALLIVLAVGLLMSLMGWVWQDLNESIMSLVNTVISVVLNPVGDAVIQLH